MSRLIQRFKSADFLQSLQAELEAEQLLKQTLEGTLDESKQTWYYEQQQEATSNNKHQIYIRIQNFCKCGDCLGFGLNILKAHKKVIESE